MEQPFPVLCYRSRQEVGEWPTRNAFRLKYNIVQKRTIINTDEKQGIRHNKVIAKNGQNVGRIIVRSIEVNAAQLVRAG